MVIYPSIASSNPLEYGKTLDALSGHPYLHIDIEDGNFTPNITFGLKTVKAIMSKCKGRKVQAHLMVTNPMDYLEELAELGIDEVYAHIEAISSPDSYIARCYSLGIVPGFALKASTDVRVVTEYLDSIGGLLFLTSAPMPVVEYFSQEAFDRVLSAKTKLPSTVMVTVDGGVDEEHFRILAEKEIDSVVLGRLVFSSGNPMATIEELQKR